MSEQHIRAYLMAILEKLERNDFTNVHSDVIKVSHAMMVNKEKIPESIYEELSIIKGRVMAFYNFVVIEGEKERHKLCQQIERVLHLVS